MSKVQAKLTYNDDNEKTGVLLTARQFKKLIEQVEDYQDYLFVKHYDKQHKGRQDKTYTREEVLAEIIQDKVKR